jgi:hypothetical protein
LIRIPLQGEKYIETELKLALAQVEGNSLKFEDEKVKLCTESKIFKKKKISRRIEKFNKYIENDLKLALAQVEVNSLKSEHEKVKLCTESEIFNIISREEFKDLINNATRGKVKIVLYDEPIFLKDKQPWIHAIRTRIW